MLISSGLREPKAITVYPAKGLLFWTDLGRIPKVERASMDGTNRKVVIRDSRVKAPKGLTLDFEENMIYIVDAKADTLWRMDLDGGELIHRRALFSLTSQREFSWYRVSCSTKEHMV